MHPINEMCKNPNIIKPKNTVFHMESKLSLLSFLQISLMNIPNRLSRKIFPNILSLSPWSLSTSTAMDQEQLLQE